MSISRDPKNADITIIDTPQGKIKFNFNLGSAGVIGIGELGATVSSFSSDHRLRAEQELDNALNRPNGTPRAQELQGKMNSIIIATQRNEPLDVGYSLQLNSENSGGAGLLVNEQSREPVLGLNFDEIKKTHYISSGGKHFETRIEDQVAHELFHYIDPYLSESNHIDPDTREMRAVWAVNQIMLADNQSPRLAYKHGIDNGNQGRYSGVTERVIARTIPGNKEGFDVPTTDTHQHRQYPHTMQQHVVASKSPSASGVYDLEATKQFLAETETRQLMRHQQFLDSGKQAGQPADTVAMEQYVKDLVKIQALQQMHTQDQHRNVAQNDGDHHINQPQTQKMPDFAKDASPSPQDLAPAGP